MKIALLFDHFGPYHKARLKGAMDQADTVGVEFYPLSRDYGWTPTETDSLPIRTVMDVPKADGFKKAFPARLASILSTEEPDAVAIPGWSSFEALTALRWCRANGIPAILMSESSAHDVSRSRPKEWIKAQIVAEFAASLVGGSKHRDYLIELGVPSESIFMGYDVVDNDYFEQRGKQRRLALAKDDPPKPFESFLLSNRFIEKKNLLRVIEAYSSYRKAVENDGSTPWRLCLLGDGELRAVIEERIASLGLRDWIDMPGFKQYDELPSYYAKASCFLHASTTEQWGLVVNEAMASGLPVLVSNRCGCAPNLVQEGVNGFTFDPFCTQAITEAMLKMHQCTPAERSDMGKASQTQIASWGPDLFGRGLKAAAHDALNKPTRRHRKWGRLLLSLLASR